MARRKILDTEFDRFTRKYNFSDDFLKNLVEKDRKTIGNWRANPKKMSVEDAEKIADALDIDFEWFVSSVLCERYMEPKDPPLIFEPFDDEDDFIGTPEEPGPDPILSSEREQSSISSIYEEPKKQFLDWCKLMEASLARSMEDDHHLFKKNFNEFLSFYDWMAKSIKVLNEKMLEQDDDEGNNVLRDFVKYMPHAPNHLTKLCICHHFMWVVQEEEISVLKSSITKIMDHLHKHLDALYGTNTYPERMTKPYRGINEWNFVSHSVFLGAIIDIDVKESVTNK